MLAHRPSAMMPRFPSLLLLGALLWVFISSPITAQDTFDIVPSATNPSNGASSVPLEETILFEYNQALNVNTDSWNVAFAEPRGRITTTRTQLCVGPEPCGEAVDDPGQQRFVRYVVEHEPDTDYTWVVYTTRNFEGTTMATPYVLRYTTASTIGQRSISGSIGTLAGEGLLMSDTPKETQELLWGLLEALERQGIGRAITPTTPIRARTTPQRDAARAPRQADTSSDDGHTIVYLLSDFSVQEPDWLIEGADVISGRSGAYEADFLRDGTYWPLAVRYSDRERRTIEGLGFYDATGNRMPDSVRVEGNSPAGIDLLMFDFPLTTARTNAGIARAFADRQLSAAQLKRIEGRQGTRTSGRAYSWRYLYASDATDEVVRVNVDPFGVETTSLGTSPSLAARLTIPQDFIDSPDALSATLDDGGQEFIDDRNFRPENLAITIDGTEHTSDSDAPAGANWRIRITGRTTSGSTTFERFVDMSTGAIVGDPPALTAASRSRGHRAHVTHYPNPTRTDVTFSLQLPESAPVSLIIYNMRGQAVAQVLDGAPLVSGAHQIAWSTADLASGVYLYRVRIGDETFSERLILHR